MYSFVCKTYVCVSVYMHMCLYTHTHIYLACRIIVVEAVARPKMTLFWGLGFLSNK